jgi:hypothetical protein
MFFLSLVSTQARPVKHPDSYIITYRQELSSALGEKYNYFYGLIVSLFGYCCCERNIMIEPGQKFQCYTKLHSEYGRVTDEPIECNMTLGGVDKEGEIAFGGAVFVCEEVKESKRKGIYIVAGNYELRRDHFMFRSVQ